MTTYIPYFYIIEHVRTSTYYVGSKYGEGSKPSDLLTTYFTSSKTIQNIIQTEGNNSFIIRKIRVFETRDEAYAYETRFLKRLNCASHPKFYNKHNNNGNNNVHFTNKDYKWYNNSIDECMYYPGTEPEGWINGRTTSSAKDKKYYNNGIICRAFYPGTEPVGWKPGNMSFGENNAMYGMPSAILDKELYCFGTEQRFFSNNEMIPEGWIKGASDEVKRKCSERSSGENNPRYGLRNEKFYNNGKINKLFVFGQEPKGWTHGLVKTGVKFYNNGIINRKFVPGQEPKGWIKGKCKNDRSIC